MQISPYRRAAFVVVLLVLAPACAGTPRPVPTVPPVPVDASTDPRAAAMWALGILDASTIVADEASQRYLELRGRVTVPAALDRDIRATFVRFADLVLTAVEDIRAGLLPATALRARLEPIVATANALVRLVDQLGTTQQIAGLASLVRTVADLVARPAAGGGRP